MAGAADAVDCQDCVLAAAADAVDCQDCVMAAVADAVDCQGCVIAAATDAVAEGSVTRAGEGEKAAADAAGRGAVVKGGKAATDAAGQGAAYGLPDVLAWLCMLTGVIGMVCGGALQDAGLQTNTLQVDTLLAARLQAAALQGGTVQTAAIIVVAVLYAVLLYALLSGLDGGIGSRDNDRDDPGRGCTEEAVQCCTVTLASSKWALPVVDPWPILKLGCSDPVVTRLSCAGCGTGCCTAGCSGCNANCKHRDEHDGEAGHAALSPAAIVLAVLYVIWDIGAPNSKLVRWIVFIFLVRLPLGHATRHAKGHVLITDRIWRQNLMTVFMDTT